MVQEAARPQRSSTSPCLITTCRSWSTSPTTTHQSTWSTLQGHRQLLHLLNCQPTTHQSRRLTKRSRHSRNRITRDSSCRSLNPRRTLMWLHHHHHPRHHLLHHPRSHLSLYSRTLLASWQATSGRSLTTLQRTLDLHLSHKDLDLHHHPRAFQIRSLRR